MFHDRLGNLDSLLGTQPATPAPDLAKLDEAFRAGIAWAAISAEMMPALRDSARAALAFYKSGVRVQVAHENLKASGITFTIPTSLASTPADLARLARAIVDLGLLDASDPALSGIDMFV